MNITYYFYYCVRSNLIHDVIRAKVIYNLRHYSGYKCVYSENQVLFIYLMNK